ncbi:hypothetical protein M885DRAFT_514371 [Pelagophyceae sp. CCMP2097]|nr:hypothetical protein M885DRAFT_514371 [Pelagophyceae sp. CCMP2097]
MTARAGGPAVPSPLPAERGPLPLPAERGPAAPRLGGPLHGPLQRAGDLQFLFGEHVLGPASFLFSADPRRRDVLAAAAEVRRSPLRAAALVCRAWRGCAQSALALEKRRGDDERRLLLDAYVQPIVSRAHLCAAPLVFKGGRLAARFARLPFKEGDVLILDSARLANACAALAREWPTLQVLRQLRNDAKALARWARGAAPVVPRSSSRQSDAARDSDDDYDDYDVEDDATGVLVRCRVSRCAAVALTRRSGGLGAARGPQGRVVVEVATECDVAGPAGDQRWVARPLFSRASTAAFNAESTEVLEPEGFERTACDASLFRRRAGVCASHTFSFPLPLLEAGVLRRVVPAVYRAPRLDWAPRRFGETTRLGSSVAKLQGAPLALLGFCREPSAPDAHDSPSQPAGVRHTLFVRDALTGESHSGDALTWGMAAWAAGHLDLLDAPEAPSVEPGDALQFPPALAHLVLDSRGDHESGDRGGRPDAPGSADDVNECAVCGLPARRRLACCGSVAYCSEAHFQAHAPSEHALWCRAASAGPAPTAAPRPVGG